MVGICFRRSIEFHRSARASRAARCCVCVATGARENCAGSVARLLGVAPAPRSARMTDLSQWTPRPTPGLVVLTGEMVRLEPLDWAAHGEGLFAAVGGEANAEIWT